MLSRAYIFSGAERLASWNSRRELTWFLEQEGRREQGVGPGKPAWVRTPSNPPVGVLLLAWASCLMEKCVERLGDTPLSCDAWEEFCSLTGPQFAHL